MGFIRQHVIHFPGLKISETVLRKLRISYTTRKKTSDSWEKAGWMWALLEMRYPLRRKERVGEFMEPRRELRKGESKGITPATKTSSIHW